MISIKTQGDFKLKELKKEINDLFINNGKEIGNTAVSFFRNSFTIKGFIDKSINKWKERKNAQNNPLMINTGALERSIRVGKIENKKIEIISDGLDYNVYANEQRQFIGKSAELEQKLLKKISEMLDKIKIKLK